MSLCAYETLDDSTTRRLGRLDDSGDSTISGDSGDSTTLEFGGVR